MADINLIHAREYAQRGWDMVPVTITVRGTKKNPVPHANWKSEGTHDTATVEAWFGPEGQALHPDQGIAILTGKRSGLFVVDVDNEYMWDQILAEPGHFLPETYRVKSRSGGEHYYFKWPKDFEGGGSKVLYPKGLDLYSEPPRLAGIDVREEGGIIFAPPTAVRDESTGLIDGVYTAVDPSVELAEVPDWILKQYRDISVKSHGGRSASNPRPKISKKDWPDTWDVAQADKQLTRMLDWARDEFQQLIENPNSLWDNGVTRVMGVLVRIVNSPWFDFDEDRLDLFLRDFAPSDPGFGTKAHNRIKNSIFRRADGDVILPDEDEDWMLEVAAILAADTKEREEQRQLADGMLANIPEEFWKARPLYQKIRDAAHKRVLSADTVFHSFLAGYCSQVPYQYRVYTGLASGTVNFEHFVAVVGPSGSGKGTSTKLGFELAKAERSGTPSTGEGLIEYFLGNEVDMDNPANFEKDGVTLLANPMYTKKVQDKHNGLFVFDEGSEISQLASRQGATLNQILLKMAMGEELSTLNATESLKRNVADGSYAVGLIAQFQVKVSGELIDQHESGMPQRFSWAATTDPTVRDVMVDPTIYVPRVPAHLSPDPIDVAISENIYKELKDRNFGIVTGKVQDDPMESHMPVKMLQTAGLLRFLDGPNTPNQQGYLITDEDWYLARLLHQTSRKVRDQLRAKVAAGRSEDYQELGRREGEKMLARQEHMEKTKHIKLRQQILDRVDKLNAPDSKRPAKVSYIKQMTSSAEAKKTIDTLLPILVDEGVLAVTEDGTYSRVVK